MPHLLHPQGWLKSTPAMHNPRRRAASLATGLVSAAALTVGMTACLPIQPVDSGPPHTDVLSVPIGEQTIIEGGDLVMALSAEPDRLDPTTSSSLYTRYVMQTMCQKLYDIDGEGELVPQLATALPSVSEDGLTVTIPVRQDATFADGTPFDANAVKVTLERGLTMKGSGRKSELGPIDSVEALDASRVQITYQRPFAPLTAALADRAGMILSPAALANDDATFGDHPICVGPFKFVKRVPQTSITVARDPLYYDAKNVHLDTITYRIMTDSNIRAANLRSGMSRLRTPSRLRILTHLPNNAMLVCCKWVPWATRV